jgi:hypothetical protein
MSHPRSRAPHRTGPRHAASAYRGGDDYPFGDTAPKAGQTAAKRMDNPDAYGYFAMHVWREIDSACYVTAELIRITDTPPATTPPTSSGDKK